jgi:DNA-binding transcriptional regulator/RsmH inhibitor MraZ
LQPLGIQRKLVLYPGGRKWPTIPDRLDSNVAEQLQFGDSAPLGYYDCSVDAKGRLKIPSDFAKYLSTLGAKFFLTSYDELDIQIYTRDSFLTQCALLEKLAENPEHQDVAEDTLFRMRDLGADVTPDQDGRIVLPPILRQRLNMTELPTSCHIGKDRDHLVVITAERYAARREKASSSNPADTAKRVRQLGLR